MSWSATSACAGPIVPEPLSSDMTEPTPVFTWAGASVGVNFGAGFGQGSPVSGFGADATLRPNEFWTLPGPNVGGVLGGLQAGYSWQWGPIVAGVEADLQAAGLSGSSKGVGASSGAVPLLAAHQTVDWFGTARGRIGYAPLPTLLVYGTGGLAYGGGGFSFAYINGDNHSGAGYENPNRVGWAAGAGLEWAFSPDWSAKLEYLYVDLGRARGVAFNLADSDDETLANAATLAGVANRFHAVRLGLNYHFNLSGPEFDVPAEPYGARPLSDKFHEIETHYIFGFTYGADIDAEGEKELEFITKVSHGRRRRAIAPGDEDFLTVMSQGGAQGLYNSIEQKVEFEHTLTQNLQYSLGIFGANHRIRGVEGINNLTNTSLRGLSGELRYVLLGRGPGSPFGVTLQVEPEWGHVSGTSGQRETAFEVETRLIVDTELIQNRLYAAVNLLYEPEIARGSGENKWERESTFGVTGGVTYRLTPQLALGGGLQYYRAHANGFWCNKLEGQALFAGPTLYARLDRRIFVSAAFSAQVAGHATGETHALDLANFNRYMARLQFGVEF
jgi:opacity protein-like surface antigen